MRRVDEAGEVAPPRLPAREIVPLLKEAFSEWMKDKAPRLAAALSYYALFSVTPILLISIALAGLVFGEEAARGEVLATVGGVVGEKAGQGIQDMIANARESEGAGTLATIVGFVMLLFGASGVFNQLKDALNTVWGVTPQKGGGILRIVRQRFLSAAMVMVVGFLLLASLVVSAILAAAGKYMENRLPGGETFWQILNLTISIVVITVLFALIFRYVPDKRIPWRDVWLGAAFTSILFALGKFAIGLYLGKSTIGTAFGAAGSIVVILVWLYYSSLIVFFGAEFTEVYARRRREGAEPRKRVAPEELLAHVRADIPAPALVGSSAERKERGGKAVPLLTGCAGLVVGLFLGVLSAIVGVFISMVRGVLRKLR